jgi:hypothetical protein
VQVRDENIRLNPSFFSRKMLRGLTSIAKKMPKINGIKNDLPKYKNVNRSAVNSRTWFIFFRLSIFFQSEGTFKITSVNHPFIQEFLCLK